MSVVTYFVETSQAYLDSAAEAVFRESYANNERWELLQASDAYNRRANAARPEAQAICDAAGNW